MRGRSRASVTDYKEANFRLGEQRRNKFSKQHIPGQVTINSTGMSGWELNESLKMGDNIEDRTQMKESGLNIGEGARIIFLNYTVKEPLILWH